MLNQEVTRQAHIIAYIDDFKLMLILAMVGSGLGGPHRGLQDKRGLTS